MSEGKGVVQYFDPPDWLIILCVVALLLGVLLILNRRQKPNKDITRERGVI